MSNDSIRRAKFVMDERLILHSMKRIIKKRHFRCIEINAFSVITNGSLSLVTEGLLNLVYGSDSWVEYRMNNYNFTV
jgi:hypothetical protein